LVAVAPSGKVTGDVDVSALPKSDAAPAGVRAKGGARSALYVQDAAGVRPLSADAAEDGAAAQVRPGDIVQVAVTSASEVFVAVVSRDGAGHVSTYVAADDGGLVRVAAGRNVPLPGATVLDDVVGAETVAVFLCDRPAARPEALAAVVMSGAPPSGCVVERHRLDKREVR
jgi:hypothetical protein